MRNGRLFFERYVRTLTYFYFSSNLISLSFSYYSHAAD